MAAGERLACISHVPLRSRGRPFVALNAAFLDDGAWIDLPAGSVLEQPLRRCLSRAAGLAAVRS
jgi:hypothetical protein